MTVLSSSENTSRLGDIFITAVILTGIGVSAYSIQQLFASPVGTQWFLLLALTLLTGSFTIAMSSLSVRVSVSETFVFASVLLFGTAAGTLTVVLETLVMSFWLRPQNRAPRRVMFNAAAPGIAIWVSGSLFYWFSGITPYLKHASPLPVLFVPLVLFTTSYFLLNTWLVAIAVAFQKHRSPWRIWWPQFTWVSVNYFSGASVAALIVTYSKKIDASTLLVIIPLLVIFYLTFRTAMGRVDDATRHLEKLNTLYWSTIETLAMAIDAKDQITHGHIRRVQAYAVSLAKLVGVKEEQLLRAIEAAALLHDMGKLAIPEHILNKPGKLTPAEFDKMKLHASIGADILSAIDFPYPVVPIVRHHHECWDGSGYPDGLRGTDIPIGARILSVVDCFDALTSDRPYRPRLSDHEALTILFERRGTMYDPLIVDTFSIAQKQLTAESASQQQEAARSIARSVRTGTEATAPASSSDEMADTGIEAAFSNLPELCTARTSELAGAMAGTTTIVQVANAIVDDLCRVIPFSVLALFVYDPRTDTLQLRHIDGDLPTAIQNITIPVGMRLSGWVAAHRTTILNSDPALDLGETARSLVPRLQSCLSAPIVLHDKLLGVLTLYSSRKAQFTEDHRRSIESIARDAAPALRRVLTGASEAENLDATLRYFSSASN